MKSKIAWAILCGLVLAVPVEAQKSIGAVTPEPNAVGDKADPLNLEVKRWVGEKFIFLERSKTLQSGGYRFSHQTNGRFRVEELEYEKYRGKILTVTSVATGPDQPTVTFEIEGSGQIIAGETYKGQIEGIASVRELAAARARWLNQTIYTKGRLIQTYDAELGKYGSVKTTIGDPLKVIDVWWGLMQGAPVWLIVETAAKEKGFIAVGMGWINKSDDLREAAPPWDRNLWEFDPKAKFKWPDDMWRRIQERKPEAGMTREQVILCLGRPKNVNKIVRADFAGEQWVYAGQTLAFEGDLLRTIQTTQ